MEASRFAWQEVRSQKSGVRSQKFRSCSIGKIEIYQAQFATLFAEGFKKRGPSDKTRFLNFAQSSLEECRYYLILIQDLGYAATTDMEALLEEVSKLLVAYASAIESNR
jgi:23S rRNA-intervening sequence protein